MFIEFHTYGGKAFIIPEDGIKGLYTEGHGVTKLKVFDDTIFIRETYEEARDLINFAIPVLSRETKNERKEWAKILEQYLSLQARQEADEGPGRTKQGFSGEECGAGV